MANCVRNICTKNYQHVIVGFQVTVKNVGNVFLTQCMYSPLRYLKVNTNCSKSGLLKD